MQMFACVRILDIFSILNKILDIMTSEEIAAKYQGWHNQDFYFDSFIPRV